MKIDKYIFLIPASVEMACTRLGISRPLTYNELFTLYAIKYIPFPPSQRHIVAHAKSMRHPIASNTIAVALMFLTSEGLLTMESKRYTITWKGREFFSYVRRYLVHKRLS